VKECAAENEDDVSCERVRSREGVAWSRAESEWQAVEQHRSDLSRKRA
jgi:hypothetical protein